MRKGLAFTIIEVLIVVGVIALLAGLLLPALGKARDRAKLLQCQINLHAIGVALPAYASDNNNYTPEGVADPQDPNSGSVLQANPGLLAAANRNPNDWNESLYVAPPVETARICNVPIGMGRLISGKIINATGGTPASAVQFVDQGYIGSIDTMFCPSDRGLFEDQPMTLKSYWAVKTHWNDGWDQLWSINHPDMNYPFLGWASSMAGFPNGSDNGFYGSYIYRARDYAFLNVVDGVEILSTQTDPTATATTVAASNLKSDSNPRYAASTLVVESQTQLTTYQIAVPQHADGGNTLWGDGSVKYFKNAQYHNGFWVRNVDALLADGTVRPGWWNLLPSYAGPPYEDGFEGANNFDISAYHGYLFAAIDYYSIH